MKKYIILLLTLVSCDQPPKPQQTNEMPYGIKKFTDGTVTCYYVGYSISCLEVHSKIITN